MSAYLNAVTKAKTAYVTAKTTLEARLRQQMREELSNLQSQVDVAVRIAYNDGQSKADIMRALGTKDYHTINASLGRTEGVEEVKGRDPLDDVYSLDGDVLTVNYVNHGPRSISGEAQFAYRKLDDGSRMLFAMTPMYNEDWSVRNEVVSVLDQQQDGFYYEEALNWLTSSSAQ